MIGQEKIQEIRDRSSIMEVISDHLALRKVGRNYLGLCPFHSEKTPSFTLNEEKGIFHCFGCGVGGNVFNFLMQYEHLTFPEAVERVGRRYGIKAQEISGARAKKGSEEKERYYRVNERAAAYFHGCLYGHAYGKQGLRYLGERGVGEEVARRFYLGYAAPEAQGLVRHLEREGVSTRDAVGLGLLNERGPKRYQERFSGRLIFPIIDPGGRVVGFGGRIIGGGGPKYINSPDSVLFHKGSQLYGLYQAREAVRTGDRVVVVEGYLDVLVLAQSGVSYAVATLGTALTPNHIHILRRFTRNVIVLFDGDDAGRKAAARGFEVFLEGGMLGHGAFLPKDEDPDSFVRSQGKEALERIIQQAVPLADYYFTWLEERYGNSLEGKSQIAQEVRRVLSRVRDPLQFDLLTARAAETLGIREEVLRRSAFTTPSSRGQRNVGKDGSGYLREDLAESSLIGAMLRFSSVIGEVVQVEDLDRLLSPAWRGAVSRILARWREHGDVDVAALAAELPAEEASMVTFLTLQEEGLEERDCQQMVKDCLYYLRRRYLRRLEEELQKAIRLAEEQRDEKAKKERMLEWQEVVRKAHYLERQKLVSRTAIQ